MRNNILTASPNSLDIVVRSPPIHYSAHLNADADAVTIKISNKRRKPVFPPTSAAPSAHSEPLVVHSTPHHTPAEPSSNSESMVVHSTPHHTPAEPSSISNPRIDKIKRLPNQLCYQPTPWNRVDKRSQPATSKPNAQSVPCHTPQNFYSCLDDPAMHDAILDSGTTGHLAPCSETHALRDVVPATNPITVMVSNSERMQSTHTGSLPIPHLPHAATHIDIIPGLAATLI